VFFKDLDKKSAESFVSDRLSKKHTRRTLKGGAALAGAPLDYITRQGIYLAPGQIPDINGHLPLSDGSISNYGSFVPYVDKGFWNPEPGHSYDPVPGQTRFPTSVPAGMGSNLVNQKGLLKNTSIPTSTFVLKIYPLYYSNYSLFSHLSFRSTKKQVFNFSLVNITKFRNSQKTGFSPLLLLESPYNIITQNEAIQFGVGGRLLCIFYRFAK
jgi:hypothetical protein